MVQKSANIIEFPENSFEPLLLSTKEHYDKYWAYAEPYIKKCLDETTHGEIDTSHIYERGLAAQNYVIVVKSDAGPEPEVKLVLVFEPRVYPNLPALNLLAIGGSDLKSLSDKYWEKLLGWAYMNGVRAIEGLVGNPAMERIIKRLGFKPIYTHMRLDLTEAQNETN
jgi:hypothetical protein|tara:strand:- start:853 stop:1353 length:501 start_codon:yes stop_codon:yes gene_type:complete